MFIQDWWKKFKDDNSWIMESDNLLIQPHLLLLHRVVAPSCNYHLLLLYQLAYDNALFTGVWFVYVYS